MKTKEAIEWIFDVWHEWENVYGTSVNQNLKEGKKLDEVIELLQRGEKFEEMWKEITAIQQNDDWEYLWMNEIKQKYFPKKGKS